MTRPLTWHEIGYFDALYGNEPDAPIRRRKRAARRYFAGYRHGVAALDLARNINTACASLLAVAGPLPTLTTKELAR